MRDGTLWGNCAGGCGAVPRSYAAIVQDLLEAPAREHRNAEIGALRAGTHGGSQNVEQTARTLLSARLTRTQLELAGYCQTCAFRGQLKAVETGLRRAANG